MRRSLLPRTIEEMSRQSAGLLMYRVSAGEIEVFLVHPGGPFWANKDAGVWTVPKGEYEDDEDPLTAAQREFKEETSFDASGDFLELGSIRQKGGKTVVAWAFEGDCDPSQLKSNTCEIEWPRRSGKRLEIPEVDRGRWFSLNAARTYIREKQVPLLEALRSLIAGESS
jgi:predicted NUDIX family NTP pyrophosphohydrolase